MTDGRSAGRGGRRKAGWLPWMMLALLALTVPGQAAWAEDDCCEEGSEQGASGASQVEVDNDSGSDGEDPCDPPDEHPEAGDPVSFPDGAYIDKHTELRAGRAGTRFRVSRYSSSTWTFPDSGLGDEWDTTLRMRVEDLGDGGARVYLGGTQPIHFASDGSGGYERSDRGRLELKVVNDKFELHYDNGDVAYFDDENNAERYVFKDETQYKWIYDGSHNLQTIEYEDEPVIAVEWDHTPDRITKVELLVDDGAGGVAVDQSVTYSYDGDQLTKVDGGCGGCGDSGAGRIYSYVDSGDGEGNIETVSNLDGEPQMTMVYDSASRVVTQYRGSGTSRAASFSYEEYDEGVYEYTDFDGFTQRLYFDDSFKQTKEQWLEGTTVLSLWEKDYDGSRNRVTAERHATRIDGGTTHWEEKTWVYDGSDNRVTRIDYATTSDETNGYVRTNAITVYRRTYGDHANLTQDIDANDVTRTYSYDGDGRITEKVVDEGGLDLTTTYTYEEDANRLTRLEQEDPDGTVTTFDYDPTTGHRLTKTVDAAGTTPLAIETVYFPDANGRVTKRVDPNGHAWQSFYGSNNKLTKTIDPSNRVTEQQYDAMGNLATRLVYNTAGGSTRTTVHLYDDLGQLTLQRRLTDPAGPTYADTAYAYSDNGRRTYTKDPHGMESRRLLQVFHRGRFHLQHALVHDGANWITRHSYERDLIGRVTRQTAANDTVVEVADRRYDGHGRLTYEEDALGHYTAMSYDDRDRLLTRVQHDSADTAVAETHMAYDALGRVTSQQRLLTPGTPSTTDDGLVEMAYDDVGRMTRQTTHLNASETAHADTVYDRAGRAITQTQSDGPTVAMSYDEGGNVLTQVTDPGDLALTTVYAYDELGRVTRTTQPDDTYRVVLYDGLGQVTKQSQHASGGTAFAVNEILYHDHLGAMTRTYRYADPDSQSAFDAQTDPSQARLYDANGRLTATEDAHGHLTSFAYDDRGRPVETVDPADNQQIVVYDDADRVLTQLRLDYDGANHVTFATAMEYDALNRVTRQIGQGTDGDITATTDNLTTTRWYDALGQVTQQEDPSGQVTASAYDALGNLTRQTEDAGQNGLARHTDRAYDRSGRLLTLTGYTDGTSGAQETVYAYSKAGVLTRTTYPDDSGGGGERGFVAFHFDSVLRLTRQNHQDDTNTDTVYDDMGRRLTVTRGSAIDSFTYTDAGQLATAKRGTSGTPDAVSEVERLYDDLLRLTRERQTIKQGTTQNVDYDYDLGGNVITRTYPDATSFSYTYTDVDQLDTLKRGGTTLASYSYVGQRPEELEMPTGTADPVVQGHAYDGMARLTRLAQSRDGAELATFAHSYDTVGNLTSRTFEHRSGDPSEDYAYDTLHRLTRTDFGQRSGDPYEGFVYDLLGNHLTQDHDGVEIAGLFNDVNEQTDRDSETLDWDLRGNLTEDDDGQQYAYDRSNLLTEVKDDQDNVIATYAYDALGRRIEKDASGGGGDTTRFYYDDQQLIEERDDTGTLQRQYVWGGTYIDELVLFTDVAGAGGAADADYLVLRHHNFNVVALVDRSDGSVVERYDYNPYGQRTVLNADFTTHSDPTAGSFAFAFGHQGLLHDHESGLVYNRARMLHPILGRFVQRDPINLHQPEGGYQDGMSLYQYVKSNPLMHTDADGHLIAPPSIPGFGRKLSWFFSCVGVTLGYASDCVSSDCDGPCDNAPFSCCAAGVSSGICMMILLDPTPDGRLACYLGQLNRCIYDYYNDRDTPLWREADQACDEHGTCSKECCRASAEAEQNAVSRCEGGAAKACGVRSPLLDPVTEPIRRRFAQRLCCAN